MLEINKIYLGDCLEIMKDIENKSIEMILCDLPYGNSNCE
jgi:DNA modification methylase